MKKKLNEPQLDGQSKDPSDYKLYGDYQILDSAQGSNLPYTDEDDEDQLYLPLNDFAGDEDLED